MMNDTLNNLFMEKLNVLFITIPFLVSVHAPQAEKAVLTDEEYISRDPQQCQTIRFACEEGKIPFFNDKGCGCTSAHLPPPIKYCTEEYRPVCGVVPVQCVTTPCENTAQTFPNRCYAERAGATHIQEGPC